jgi:hypothetical protein
MDFFKEETELLELLDDPQPARASRAAATMPA